MATVENKHWDNLTHRPALTSWASYLALGTDEHDAFNYSQQQIMADYLTGSIDTYVQSLGRLQVIAEAPEMEIAFTVVAEDEDDAIEHTVVAGLGAMASIGIHLQTVELLACHLANQEQLLADQRVIPGIMITNLCYDLTDDAQEVFPHEVALMTTYQRLARPPAV